MFQTVRLTIPFCMSGQDPNVEVLFVGIQITLLGIFLLLMTQSVDIFAGMSADVFLGASILCAAVGTAVVVFGTNEQLYGL